VIAVDTNLLIYAHRPDTAWHEPAKFALDRLVASGSTWAIPAPCLHEFLAIVTRGRIFRPPTPIENALRAVQDWLDAPDLLVLAETDAYWRVLYETLRRSGVTGPRVHDARIAALCLVHGVDELWSADRDFNLFPELRVRNPFGYSSMVHEG
jgi:toxin-antitoxin system PIN domain toxin